MRPSKLLTIVVLPAALGALAISGCGGGGSDSTASTQATTGPTAIGKADLISQGDSICGEVNAAIGSLGASEAEVPKQITQTSDLYVGMVERIKGLGRPDDPTGYAEFIAAAEELAKVEGEVKLAAEREDTAVLGTAATDAAPVLEEFESQAGIYGFEQCSEGPKAPTPSGSGTGNSAAPAEEEGGVEAAPEEVEEEAVPEAAAPEEVAPETGGAGGGVGEAAPETGSGTSGGSSGGVGPG